MSEIEFLIVGAIAVGVSFLIFKPLLSSRRERKEMIDEFSQSPIKAVWASVGILSLLGFFWGILFPPVGQILVEAGGLSFELWQIFGLTCLIWLIVGLFTKGA